jgi:hypothetical protein
MLDQAKWWLVAVPVAADGTVAERSWLREEGAEDAVQWLDHTENMAWALKPNTAVEGDDSLAQHTHGHTNASVREPAVYLASPTHQTIVLVDVSTGAALGEQHFDEWAPRAIATDGAGWLYVAGVGQGTTVFQKLPPLRYSQG